ncbi:hypothetical protein [Bacillus sp. B-jedd]|uniref:hypothetical protein n=1 Tax=Bacillus sp. B-jedd TaxID=1476857 RepID=UPI00051561A3|nr:hypothetical protein [Bacillus sp. B-jedd]CEG26218.1 hypothetical protein BN1002_01060 [Bacillus sp. B-jedd]
MKKTINIFLSFVLALFLTPNVTQAEISPMTAGWQTILSGYYTATEIGVRSHIVESGGGDIRLCINGVNANNLVTVIIMSDNGDGDAVDSFVISHNIGGGTTGITTKYCFPADDARPFVDGTNNKAEFYLKLYSKGQPTDTVYVELQD